MKEYIKPEVEYIDFVTEPVTSDHMGGDDESSNVQNPWGP